MAVALPTVLIVDDDDEIRALLLEGFTAAGLHVVEATDGQAAVDLARRASPAAVLLDINLPKLNGMEALTRIRTAARSITKSLNTPLRDSPAVYLIRIVSEFGSRSAM